MKFFTKLYLYLLLFHSTLAHAVTAFYWYTQYSYCTWINIPNMTKDRIFLSHSRSFQTFTNAISILFITKKEIMKNYSRFVLLAEANKKTLTKPKTDLKSCIDFRSCWSSSIVAYEAFLKILVVYTFWFLLEG